MGSKWDYFLQGYYGLTVPEPEYEDVNENPDGIEQGGYQYYANGGFPSKSEEEPDVQTEQGSYQYYANGGFPSKSEEEPDIQTEKGGYQCYKDVGPPSTPEEEPDVQTGDDIKKWGIILRRLADSFEERYVFRRRMQKLGKHFRTIVERMKISPVDGLSAVRHSLLQKEVLSDDEMNAVKLIDTYINDNRQRTSTNISEIAAYLRKCLTANTFRVTLASLCYDPSSVPEELAVACDLVAVIYPRFQEFVSAEAIHSEFIAFIERSLDEDHH